MPALRRPRPVFLAAYAGLTIGAALAFAASPVQSMSVDGVRSPIDTYALGASADTIVLLLTPRAEEEIQDDILAAQAATLAASQDRALAELARADAKTRVEIAKDQIEFLENEKDRLENLRDRTEDSAARNEFERQKNEIERQKDAQDRRKRLFEASEDLAEAERELAEELERQAQADTELYRRELQLSIAPESALPEVERRVLEAWKTAMERAENVASRRKRVIERQMTVLDRAKDIRENG